MGESSAGREQKPLTSLGTRRVKYAGLCSSLGSSPGLVEVPEHSPSQTPSSPASRAPVLRGPFGTDSVVTYSV